MLSYTKRILNKKQNENEKVFEKANFHDIRKHIDISLILIETIISEKGLQEEVLEKIREIKKSLHILKENFYKIK